MISITNQAIEKLQVLLKDETSMTPRALRVLVKTTGCSGLAYNLEYAYYANGEDHIQQSFSNIQSPCPRDPIVRLTHSIPQ